MVVANPSHRVDSLGDRVVIRGLELFVGFDKSIDDPDDKRVKKYDKKTVQAVIDRTEKFIARGQTPKLILGHNDSESDSSYVRPVIGDITNLQLVEIGEAAGIAGDVTMTNDDFESYLKSNSFPRRSAEIWADGFMSEVALLGSETPARPLPDTRFGRSSCSSQRVDHFARIYPALFAEPSETASGPGPGNTHIPTAGKKRKNEMPKDDDDKTKLAELEDENKKLKAKLAKYEKEDEPESNQKDDDDDKEKNDHDDKDTNARIKSLEKDVAKFKRQAVDSSEQLAAVSSNALRRDIANELDKMARQGYRVGNGQDRDDLIDRIVAAQDPKAELEFWSKRLPRDPVDLTIDQFGASLGLTGENSDLTVDQQVAASDRAVKRCTDEKKPEMFSKYLGEELDKEAA